MQRRFLLDSDGSNVFHGPPEAWADVDDLVRQTVDECSPEVTTYLLCSNAGTCNYPTTVSAMDPTARAFAEGIGCEDPFGRLLAGIKASGRETFVTVRMNDVHNPDAADQHNTPTLRREHPDYIVAPDEVAAGGADWMAWCLDYTRPPVRRFFLDLLAELVERYGDRIDGIQLDWMRFPRHLPGLGDQPWQRRQALTGKAAATSAWTCPRGWPPAWWTS